ncbi:T9SS type A sorting domain-containing protein [Ferruginibacter lapsinanis]|uniref:T9SS type A sorting domain-containing protein n=1 Tax=Ferruginibacter lapsinanis TaxID=563172 RepID=UPI001E408498|nr:T9SS type A sorting domain-containing protein [Ferruginibacter lapsinanis]UEG50209.1 T9SS type A sorting domain-containing protein [Ferruginibacter lapsinanis]
MKKIFISTLSLVLLASVSFAQKFSTKVTKSLAGDAITFSIVPDADVTTDFSVVEFFIKYPIASPQATYGTIAVNTTNFPGMTIAGALGEWFIEKDNAAYTIPGYHVDHLVYTAPAAVTTSRLYSAGTVYDMITIPISGVTLDDNFRVVHQDSEASFYVALSSGGGADLRPASLNSMFVNTLTEGGPDGSTIYYTNIPFITPVKFTTFSASRKDNNASLLWQITNEDVNVASYEVERSDNGVSFTKVATVAPKNNGSTSNSYNILDNLSTVKNAGIVYYRIKQIDKDGRLTYSDIRSVRISASGIAIGVYPNPVKNTANLTLDLTEDAPVTINVTDITGKEVKRLSMNALKGLNVKSVDMSSFASGSYLIKVQAGADVKTLSVVKAN